MVTSDRFCKCTLKDRINIVCIQVLFRYFLHTFEAQQTHAYFRDLLIDSCMLMICKAIAKLIDIFQYKMF